MEAVKNTAKFKGAAAKGSTVKGLVKNGVIFFKKSMPNGQVNFKYIIIQ